MFFFKELCFPWFDEHSSLVRCVIKEKYSNLLRQVLFSLFRSDTKLRRQGKFHYTATWGQCYFQHHWTEPHLCMFLLWRKGFFFTQNACCFSVQFVCVVFFCLFVSSSTLTKCFEFLFENYMNQQTPAAPLVK